MNLDDSIRNYKRIDKEHIGSVKVLGEVDRVEDGWVYTNLSIHGRSVPVRFPKKDVEKTNVDIKPGNFFYWESNAKGKIDSDNFYHADDIVRHEVKGDIEKMAEDMRRDFEEGAYQEDDEK